MPHEDASGCAKEGMGWPFSRASLAVSCRLWSSLERKWERMQITMSAKMAGIAST